MYFQYPIDAENPLLITFHAERLHPQIVLASVLHISHPFRFYGSCEFLIIRLKLYYLKRFLISDCVHYYLDFSIYR